MMPGGNTSIMEPFFWAYSVTKEGHATITRCETAEDAEEEHGRLRMSDCKRIGHSTCKHSEADMWKMCRANGWKLQHVRWFKPVVAFNRERSK